MTILFVCGGRDFNDKRLLESRLNTVHKKHSVTQLVAGGARGADTLAEKWAKDKEITHFIFPAPWKRFGKSAGIMRNALMVDYLQNRMEKGNKIIGIVFPGGKGTADMVTRLRKYRIPFVEVNKPS